MLKLMMRDDEKDMFMRYLSKAKFYFEFGSGGSTVLASSIPSIQKIIAVESDPEWMKAVEGAVDLSRCTIIHGDIGPIKPNFCGHPLNPVAQADRFENYWKPLLVLEGVSQLPDLILVDGRFRVQCLLQSLLKAPAATYLFHDYTIRDYYWVVEKYCDRIETVHTLVAFRRKEGLSSADEAIAEEARRYRQVPS